MPYEQLASSRDMSRRVLRSLSPSLLVIALATGCRQDPPAGEPTPATDPAPAEGKAGAPTTTAATATPPEETLPTLRTGERAPIELPAVTATAVREFTDRSGVQYLELSIDGVVGEDTPELAVLGADASIWTATQVQGRSASVFVRRRDTGIAATALTGTLWSSRWERNDWTLFGGSRRGNLWSTRSFTVTGTPTNSPDLPAAFAAAASSELRGRGFETRFESPFHAFAAARVHAALLGTKAAAAAVATAVDVRRPSNDFTALMYTTTAATSLQEALQYDKGLRTVATQGKREVPIADIAAPALADHPFAAMRAGLPAGAEPTPEPLAAAAPAEFWYVRFDDIRDMLRVLDEADAWLTPVAHAFEERPLVRDLAGRYQRQLGLGRSGLAKALGHTVISRVAIVGSDPYLREGSDVTFVFDVASQAAFETELSRHLATWSGEVPGVTQREVQHEGHVITVHADPAGLVRQHRAQVGTLAIVSNSEAACRRVLDSIDGRKPRLADEPDLQYMLARDPGTHDGLAFIGDRFVAEVVGPAQKIQQARRMQALAELAVPGHAALLYGWLNGRAPTDTAEMIAAGVLGADELAHADGTSIQFAPGSAAHSDWGSPEALTPRIDLPAVTHASAEERVAYETFARGYQDYWRQFIDPIAVRFDLEGDRADLDVRVLPLIEGTDYRDIEEVVGKQRVRVPAIDGGVQAVWAVGRDTSLRRDLDRMAGSMSGKADLGLGWLGGWVAVGGLDRAGLLELMSATDARVQLAWQPPAAEPRDRELVRRVGRLPLYAAAEVSNPASLVATLAAARTLLNEVAPGAIGWESVATHHDVPIVRIGVTDKGTFAEYADTIAIYYAQTPGAIVLALQRSTLETLIDRFADAERRPLGVDADGTQFAIEARVVPDHALSHALLWLLQGQALEGQISARAFAEAILRGDPSASDPARFEALARAYFGGVPVTPEGRFDYAIRDGVVGDPLHGSEVRPRFPALPVAGASPIATLLTRLSGVRASVAFDDEPAKLPTPARSLHTQLTLELGASAE